MVHPITFLPPFSPWKLSDSDRFTLHFSFLSACSSFLFFFLNSKLIELCISLKRVTNILLLDFAVVVVVVINNAQKVVVTRYLAHVTQPRSSDTHANRTC